MTYENKISVILPVFNTEKFVNQAIQSVLEQTFSDFELIIIDDASTDNTIEVIKQFKDPRIRLIRKEKNKGVCEARNTGLEAANGSWIAPLDADDVWHTDRLTKLLNTASKTPEAFIGSNVMFCFSDRNNRIIPWRTLYERHGIKRGYLFYPNANEVIKYKLATTWPIFPLEVIKKFNIKFQPEFTGHDWLMLVLNLLRKTGLRYIIINEPLYFYRITSDSSSNSWADMMTQLKTYTYLQSQDWLDKESIVLINRDARFLRYRLLAVALRERNWIKSILLAIRTPMSILYLFYKLPQWIAREYDFYKLTKK